MLDSSSWSLLLPSPKFCLQVWATTPSYKWTLRKTTIKYVSLLHPDQRFSTCGSRPLSGGTSKGLRIRYLVHQIFILQFVTVTKLLLQSSRKNNFMLEVTTVWGTVLKDYSLRKVGTILMRTCRQDIRYLCSHDCLLCIFHLVEFILAIK